MLFIYTFQFKKVLLYKVFLNWLVKIWEQLEYILYSHF